MILNFSTSGLNSKGLYFKLNNALQLADYTYCSKQYKFAGLYSIYKNNVCLYVGQSQNLCSRIATHLTGRYATADRIDLFTAVGNGFDDFYDRSKESRKGILERNELKLINELNPIENIIVDREIECTEMQLFESIAEKYKEDTDDSIYPCITLHLNKTTATITDGCFDPTWVVDMPKSVLDLDFMSSYLDHLKGAK